jgi:hypothetical protein
VPDSFHGFPQFHSAVVEYGSQGLRQWIRSRTAFIAVLKEIEAVVLAIFRILMGHRLNGKAKRQLDDALSDEDHADLRFAERASIEFRI